MATAILHAQELTLDEAIARAARDIEGELPERAMVLLLNVTSPSEALSSYVLNELTDLLVMGRRIAVVDRRNLAAIREEMNLQISGEVSDESALSIGRLLGAHYIVSGALDERGVNYRLRVRIVGVETARILTSIIVDIRNDAQVTRLIGGASAVAEMERRRHEDERARQRAEAREEHLRKLRKPGLYLDTGVIGGMGVVKYNNDGLPYDYGYGDTGSIDTDISFQGKYGLKAGYGPFGEIPLYAVGDISFGFSHVIDIGLNFPLFAGAGVIFYPVRVFQLGASFGAGWPINMGNPGFSFNISAALDMGKRNHGFLLGFQYTYAKNNLNDSQAEAGAEAGVKAGVKAADAFTLSSFDIFFKYAHRKKTPKQTAY